MMSNNYRASNLHSLKSVQTYTIFSIFMVIAVESVVFSILVKIVSI